MGGRPVGGGGVYQDSIMTHQHKPLRFALFGADFWAPYQLAAWQELAGVECVAIYNRTRVKAEKVARQCGIPAVYDHAEELLQREQVDFIDIVTSYFVSHQFVALGAQYRVPVISQKPMAPTLALGEQMVATCRDAGVPLYIHENWRWQAPLRACKHILETGVIGVPFRARITMVSGFPVFINEPHLKELEEFLLLDMGTHTLDVARFFFGEADSLYCQNARIHPDIKGEDVSTLLLKMGGKTTVTVEMGYPENYLEKDPFPQTLVYIEGDKGTLEIDADYRIHSTTAAGTTINRFTPHHYRWADPHYDVVHASIVDCNANLLQALRGEGPAETTGEDNLQTLRLVFAAYDSARTDQVIHFARG